MIRMHRPETTKLSIADGDWLLVKTRLTAGEDRQIFGRMVKKMVAGEKPEIDAMQAGISTVVEYLLDWSIVDPDGKPVVIRDQPPQVIAAACDALDSESFREIQDAINQHVETQKMRLDEEKKLTTGAPASPVISESLA
jgi:hypothetical protein